MAVFPKLARVAVAILVATFSATACYAIDYQPFDWTPLPPGTDVLMGYGEFTAHNEYSNTITGTFKNDTQLYQEIGVIRYLHYAESPLLGHQWDFNVMLPFGSLSDGKINGQRLGSATGVSDPVVSAGFWLINQPEQRRYLSAASYLTIPIGSYDSHQALNLGNNRWETQLQGDFTQGIGKKLTLDVSAAWTSYGDNDKAGDGHQRLTQASTYEAYAWVSYDLTDVIRRGFPNAANAMLSIGYAGTFGGKQSLDGLITGTKTREDQIRLTYMMMFTPTWQGLVSFSRDVDVSGGFKQNAGLLLRIAKMF